MTTPPNLSRITRNLGTVLRSERLIARRHLQAMRRQTALMALAGLIAVLGLVMGNIAAFLALNDLLGGPLAALIVAGGDLVLAGLLALIAAQQTPGSELDPAVELRDHAIGELEQDLDDTLTDLRRVARDPFGSALPALIGPLLRILLKSMPKKDG